MHAAACLTLAVLMAGGPAGPTSPADALGPPLSGRVTVALASTPAVLRPGEPVMVHVEVAPQRGIRVYAPGNRDYLPVSLSLDWPRQVKAEEPRYPAAEPYVFGELKELVQVYSRPFRITQKVTLAAGPAASRGRTIDVSGVLRYQSCDDRVCFPVESIPLHLTIPVDSAGSNARPAK
jgi:hypothetical protein